MALSPRVAERARVYGALVRRHRLRKSLSQAELARRAGLSPSLISKIEIGNRGIGSDAMPRLVRVLGGDFVVDLVKAIVEEEP